MPTANYKNIIIAVALLATVALFGSSCAKVFASRQASAEIQEWVTTSVTPGMALPDVQALLDKHGVSHVRIFTAGIPDDEYRLMAVATNYESTLPEDALNYVGIQFLIRPDVKPFVYIHFDSSGYVERVD